MSIHRRPRLRGLRFTAAIAILAGLGISASPARADTPPDYTYTVNTFADNAGSHDVTPGNGICLDANGKCSIRAAVEEASYDFPPGGTSGGNHANVLIIVPPGT